MRADRLLSLALLLQARGTATARALAGELGVSVRTVYRDLAALGAAGGASVLARSSMRARMAASGGTPGADLMSAARPSAVDTVGAAACASGAGASLSSM